MRRSAVTALLALLLASPAFAWNKAGHEAIAAIAYDILSKDHPESLSKLVALLRQMPDFEKTFGTALADCRPTKTR